MEYQQKHNIFTWPTKEETTFLYKCWSFHWSLLNFSWKSHQEPDNKDELLVPVEWPVRFLLAPFHLNTLSYFIHAQYPLTPWMKQTNFRSQNKSFLPVKKNKQVYIFIFDWQVHIDATYFSNFDSSRNSCQNFGTERKKTYLNKSKWENSILSRKIWSYHILITCDDILTLIMCLFLFSPSLLNSPLFSDLFSLEIFSYFIR